MCTYTQAHVCTQARVCVHTHLHTTCPPLPSTLHSSHQCPACPGPVGPHARLLPVITQGTADPGEGARGPSRSDATSPTPPPVGAHHLPLALAAEAGRAAADVRPQDIPDPADQETLPGNLPLPLQRPAGDLPADSRVSGRQEGSRSSSAAGSRCRMQLRPRVELRGLGPWPSLFNTPLPRALASPQSLRRQGEQPTPAPPGLLSSGAAALSWVLPRVRVPGGRGAGGGAFRQEGRRGGSG